MSGKKWTQADLGRLDEMRRGGASHKEISAELGRTLSSVSQMVSRRYGQNPAQAPKKECPQEFAGMQPREVIELARKAIQWICDGYGYECEEPINLTPPRPACVWISPKRTKTPKQ